MGHTDIMKLLILSAISISSISSFKIPESEAKLVLSRTKRANAFEFESHEDKTDKKMIEKCGDKICNFEEWGEIAERYKTDGWDEITVRLPEKQELFNQKYVNCI